MNYRKIAKQMVDFQRHAFNNGFNMMVLFQDQLEKFGNQVIEQAAWLPEETKVWVDDCKVAIKKGREGYKKLADDTFQHIEAYLVQV